MSDRNARILSELSRDLLKITKDKVEGEGGTLLYGDTDTTFFRLGDHVLQLTMILKDTS